MAGRKGPAKPRAVTNGTDPTRDARNIFIEHLRKTGNISASARHAGVSRTTVHRWRAAEPEFAERWDDAEEEGIDALEQEARRRAIEGDEEYVVSMGQLVRDPKTGEYLTTRKRSDGLMTLLLKAHRPEKFRERYDVQQSGNITMNITKDDDAL
ncbi:helix-turn-helix domain-containing protein [Komagataeibacter melaceti]|uniref:helix-turn-helix domain-containing protein n=1 Tax=Komagataeibacter melaceti TaxID=2766577 RepID=UPI0011E5BDB6|nr:helix-turn-helix domain-containing protein [Komagataeibacter melaceti]